MGKGAKYKRILLSVILVFAVAVIVGAPMIGMKSLSLETCLRMASTMGSKNKSIRA